MNSYATLRRYGPPIALMSGVASLYHRVIPKYDPLALADAEKRLLAYNNTPLNSYFVQVGEHAIHTIVGGKGPPLVMIHGHGNGVGGWFNNYDALAEHFRIYAIDLLGWGRSDRPSFDGKSPQDALDWWLTSFETWRKKMGLTNFFLLGHSLGGWLATQYTLRYGQHIRQLLLANPAGIVDQLTIGKGLLYYISPQRIMRAAGPLGQWLIESRHGEQVAHLDGGSDLLAYYYHLSKAPFSGQLAFQKLLSLNPLKWCLPLEQQVSQLSVPTKLIWGINDPIFPIEVGHILRDRLPQADFIPLANAGHTSFIEDPQAFNEAMIRIRHETTINKPYDPFSMPIAKAA